LEPAGAAAADGTRVPLEGDNIIGRVFRTQQPARIDDYADAADLVAEKARFVGVRAAAGFRSWWGDASGGSWLSAPRDRGRCPWIPRGV
jgi:hypothetical protein